LRINLSIVALGRQPAPPEFLDALIGQRDLLVVLVFYHLQNLLVVVILDVPKFIEVLFFVEELLLLELKDNSVSKTIKIN